MSGAPNTKITRPETSGENAPEFDAVAATAFERYGYVSLTIFEWIPDRSALKRIWSSDPENFPVNGEKVMPTEAPWPQTVIVARQPHLAKNEQEIRETYNDHESIIGGGIESVSCYPVMDPVTLKTIGVYNFQGGQGKYTDETREGLQGLISQEGTAAMLRYKERAV